LIDVLAEERVEWETLCKELAKLHAALREMERASVFRKALVAEQALLAAVVLIEQMVDEIEKLKSDKQSQNPDK
jgi:hypothetical protein